jgi:DNA helicase II / ATP-dependent DNA helicase PcrA
MSGAEQLDGLNPEQRAAVEHFEGPLLVLAGAGSGKTRVLTARVAQLVEEFGVDPAAILAVTFTNKAAGEMRERVRRLLGREPAGMWLGTFHALGARLLRRHATLLGWSPNFTIYDADEALRETKRALERLNHSPKRWHPKAVLSAISGAKNQLVDVDEYATLAADPFSRVAADVYRAYQAALKEQNAFDFDDLLVMPVTLFRQRPELLRRYHDRFQFLLVDEYQDTNRAQYEFLRLLALGPAAIAAAAPGAAPPQPPPPERPANLMVVGDDDQSIYGWRGADIRNILDFEHDFPDARVIRLEQNYRSTARILEAANHVIAQNVRRKGKTLRTEAGPGEALTRVECVDERDEAEWITGEIEARLAAEPGSTGRDFVILYRTNAQSRALEEVLRRRGLPYQIVGGTRFYERREIMDALAYLRLLSNPRDLGAFDRIVNYPRRGIGDTSRGRLLAWAAEQGLGPVDAAERAAECPGLPPAGATALRDFAGLVQRYRALAAQLPAGELLGTLIQEIRLIEALEAEGPEGEDRIANVRELVAGASDFAERPPELEEEDAAAGATSLDLFLQHVALVTDVDRHDPQANVVTLMTLHNAKGLEYPVVFIAGLEEGLFPLSRAYDDPATLEEERRLFYVGITRARRKLFLTHVRTRRRAGEVLPCMPSSFLAPLTGLVEERRTPALARAAGRTEDRWRRGRDGGAAGGSGRGRRREDEFAAAARAARAEAGAPDPGDDGGPVVDYSDSQDLPRFVKGERVVHPQFGGGTIRELTGFGADLKAVIEFDSIGRKKVVVRYANLQKDF